MAGKSGVEHVDTSCSNLSFYLLFQLLRGEDISDSEKVLVERIRPWNSDNRSRTELTVASSPGNKHPILKQTTKWIMAANAEKVMEEKKEVQKVQVPSLKMSDATSTVTTLSSVVSSSTLQTTSILSQSITSPAFTVSQKNAAPKVSAFVVQSDSQVEAMDTTDSSDNAKTNSAGPLPIAPTRAQTAATTISTDVTPSRTVVAAPSAVTSTPSAQITPVTVPMVYTNIQGNLVPLPAAPIVQVIVVNQCVKPAAGSVSDCGKLTPIAPAPLVLRPSAGELLSVAERSVEVTRRRSHVCPYDNCDKTYFKSSHLKAHIRTHTGRQECHAIVDKCLKFPVKQPSFRLPATRFVLNLFK